MGSSDVPFWTPGNSPSVCADIWVLEYRWGDHPIGVTMFASMV
jgi:hypothetical protein